MAAAGLEGPEQNPAYRPARPPRCYRSVANSGG